MYVNIDISLHMQPSPLTQYTVVSSHNSKHIIVNPHEYFDLCRLNTFFIFLYSHPAVSFQQNKTLCFPPIAACKVICKYVSFVVREQGIAVRASAIKKWQKVRLINHMHSPDLSK